MKRAALVTGSLLTLGIAAWFIFSIVRYAQGLA